MNENRPKPPYFPLLCSGFLICGTATILAGPLLPVMASRWGLRDVQSGGFFAVQFTASTIGAILAPLHLRRNLARGFALIAAGLLLVCIAGGPLSPIHAHAVALAGFTAIGFGIGLSVTSTNLVVGGTGTGGSAQHLAIANLFWGLGAVGCPSLVATAENQHHLRGLLLLLACAAAAICVAAHFRFPSIESAAIPDSPSAFGQWRALLWFAALLFLYVGAENTVGGWIATYAHRYDRLTVERADILVSVFWLALLTGRGLAALLLRVLSDRLVLLLSLGIAAAATAALLFADRRLYPAIVVAMAGFGFGPIFPIAVARALHRLSDQRMTGLVFAVSAAGGALLPWLTGLASTRIGSLRIALSIPIAALALIFLLAITENAALQARSPLLAFAPPAPPAGLKRHVV